MCDVIINQNKQIDFDKVKKNNKFKLNKCSGEITSLWTGSGNNG